MKKVAFLFFILILLCSERALHALDVVVSSNQDPSEMGKVTLREAIDLVNNSVDMINRISFDLGGADPVIFLDSVQGLLPPITSRVILDGIDKFSQQIVFIDGSNLVGTELSSEVIGLHLSDNGAALSAANSVIKNIGLQNFHNLSLFTFGILVNGLAVNCTISGVIIQNITASIEADGIYLGANAGSINNNVIKNLIGDSNGSFGIASSADINGSCSGNTIENLKGSSVFGIAMDEAALNGNCTNNVISNIEGSDSAYGIILGALNGNCSNNLVSHVSSSGTAMGITVSSIASQKQVVCNDIDTVTVNMSSTNLFVAVGLLINTASDITITRNTINNINSILGDADATGILIPSVDNSFVTNNVVSNINGADNNGSGIVLLSESTGNDILSNSIFNINYKAISIIDDGGLADARVVLNSATCSDGCKIIVDGDVIISPQVLNASKFLLQFFVSPSGNPSEAKTLIGEYTYNGSLSGNFSAKLSTAVPVQFGQFITATATALFIGTQENLNTSEVSNAIPSCATFSNFCECPNPQPEQILCPAIDCGDLIV